MVFVETKNLFKCRCVGWARVLFKLVLLVSSKKFCFQDL